MSYNTERERERDREFRARASACTCICTYICISVREAEKGRREIFPLARAHARSIVPAGGHFVLARRPGVPDDPGKILADDPPRERTRWTLPARRGHVAAGWAIGPTPGNADERVATRVHRVVPAGWNAPTFRDEGQFVSCRIPFRGSPLVRGTAGHESTRMCGESWFANIDVELTRRLLILSRISCIYVVIFMYIICIYFMYTMYMHKIKLFFQIYDSINILWF